MNGGFCHSMFCLLLLLLVSIGTVSCRLAPAGLMRTASASAGAIPTVQLNDTIHVSCPPHPSTKDEFAFANMIAFNRSLVEPSLWHHMTDNVTQRILLSKANASSGEYSIENATFAHSGRYYCIYARTMDANSSRHFVATSQLYLVYDGSFGLFLDESAANHF